MGQVKTDKWILPEGETWPNKTAPIKHIVLHCTDVQPGINQKEWDVIANINKNYRRPNNHISTKPLPSIPYHYAIGESQVWWLLDEKKLTWHAKGINMSSIGLAMLYRATNSRYSPPYTMMLRVIDLIAELLFKFKLNLDSTKLSPNTSVMGHREVGKYLDMTTEKGPTVLKECPGNLIDLDLLRYEVMLRYEILFGGKNG